MKSRSQIYSNQVFPHVQALADGPMSVEQKKKYKMLSKKAGGLLRTVGLVQFLTFLAAKKAKETQHGDLLKYLREELSDLNLIDARNDAAFLEEVRKMELPQYMRITSVTLQLLQWHKRISEILIAGTN